MNFRGREGPEGRLDLSASALVRIYHNNGRLSFEKSRVRTVCTIFDENQHERSWGTKFVKKVLCLLAQNLSSTLNSLPWKNDNITTEFLFRLILCVHKCASLRETLSSDPNWSYWKMQENPIRMMERKKTTLRLMEFFEKKQIIYFSVQFLYGSMQDRFLHLMSEE